MRSGEIINLLKSLRLNPHGGSICSVLGVLEDALRPAFRQHSLVLHIPGERMVYITSWPMGIDRDIFAEALNISNTGDLEWVILNIGSEGEARTGDDEISVCRIPLYRRHRSFGFLSLIRWDGSSFDNSGREALPLLSEVFSLIIVPCIGDSGSEPAGSGREPTLKEQLLDAAGYDEDMETVLSRMMELSRADYCGFFSSGNGADIYLMLGSPKLAGAIGEVEHKLVKAYSMFSNTAEPDDFTGRVFYRSGGVGDIYTEGDSAIKSHFLVPVLYGGEVRGILFFGSVRREAFVRENISVFHSMADSSGERERVVHSLESDSGMLERWLSVIPFGCALISPSGEIITSNRRFRDILGIGGRIPPSITGINRVSEYNFKGLWKEFNATQNEMEGRLLSSGSENGGILSVTWVNAPSCSGESGSLVMIQDITGQMRKREEERRFVATVAHELRTPLTALKNSLKILMELAGKEDRADAGNSDKAGPAKKFLTTATRTLNKLSVLVDGLIDVYKLSGSEDTVDAEVVDVKDFIGEASTLFMESMNRKNIRFRVETGSSISEMELDRNRIEQVIQNLISNSVKNTIAGGEISVTVSAAGKPARKLFPLVPWDYLPRPEVIDIAVRDSGSGIPDEVSEYISGENGDYGVRKPPGLGLLISRELVKRHGGRVEIESGRDIGSVVHLYLFRRIETGMMVRTVENIQSIVNDFLKKGKSPVVYTLVKKGGGCWIELSGMWRKSPVLEPESAEINDLELYLWPLGEKIAIGVTCNQNMIEQPVSALSAGREGLRVVKPPDSGVIDIGWAVSPRDGIKFAELLDRSLEMVRERVTATV